MKIFECKAYPEFSIVAYSYETSNSWGHKATLLHNNDYALNKHKITYYNRTWECYKYQSVIQAVLSTYMQEIIDDFISDYKDTYNKKTITRHERIFDRPSKIGRVLSKIRNIL